MARASEPASHAMPSHEGLGSGTSDKSIGDAMGLPQKTSFVRSNPEYGYRSAVEFTDAGDGLPRLPIDSIRERDFPSLLQPATDATATTPTRRRRQQHQQQQQQVDLVYLDHAGATLFGVSQLREAMEPLLAGAVHGNPHSQVHASRREIFSRTCPWYRQEPTILPPTRKCLWCSDMLTQHDNISKGSYGTTRQWLTKCPKHCCEVMHTC